VAWFTDAKNNGVAENILNVSCQRNTIISVGSMSYSCFALVMYNNYFGYTKPRSRLHTKHASISLTSSPSFRDRPSMSRRHNHETITQCHLQRLGLRLLGLRLKRIHLHRPQPTPYIYHIYLPYSITTGMDMFTHTRLFRTTLLTIGYHSITHIHSNIEPSWIQRK